MKGTHSSPSEAGSLGRRQVFEWTSSVLSDDGSALRLSATLEKTKGFHVYDLI